MKLTICSGFNPANKDVYGLRFYESFRKNLAPTVGLKIYVEEPTPELGAAERSLWDCRGMREFLDRTASVPEYNGRRPPGMTDKMPRLPIWRQREWETDYAFRFDARKFSRQLFIPEAAADDLPDGDVLTWLDGDTVALKPVPEGLISGVLAGADGAFLGRMGTHSEIGFWCVRLSKGTRAFLTSLADMYRSDKVLTLRETHSAFVWDTVRNWLPGLHFRNLTPTGVGHVFNQSPIGNYIRHDKGKLKSGGTRG